MDRKFINETEQDVTETGEVSGVVKEDDGDIIKDPFDPRSVKIQRRTISLDQVIRRLNNHTINLVPEFQRNAVWDSIRKCQLIESLMLGIPLPSFYVSENQDGSWDVVDGLQRLTTLKEFFIEKTLVLQNLEFIKNHEGKNIDSPDFDSIMYNKIYETEFLFFVIEKGTPDAVKYNIFKRINTGGMFLSPQEIRHALYQGKSTTFLKELSLSLEFRNATDNSINDSRMAAREIILRCLSFLILGTEGYAYNDNMESFLRKGIQVLNYLEMPEKLIEKKIYTNDSLPDFKINNYIDLSNYFLLSMKRNYEIFGKYAFRYSKSIDKRSPINKALFDSWGTILAFLSEGSFQKILQKKDLLISLYDKKKEDYMFYNAVSKTAWQKNNVLKRFSEINSLIQEVLR